MPPKFGDVLRYTAGDLTVMVIGKPVSRILTAEGTVAGGEGYEDMYVVLVLDKDDEVGKNRYLRDYWPFHGTATATLNDDWEPVE